MTVVFSSADYNFWARKMLNTRPSETFDRSDSTSKLVSFLDKLSITTEWP